MKYAVCHWSMWCLVLVWKWGHCVVEQHWLLYTLSRRWARWLVFMTIALVCRNQMWDLKKMKNDFILICLLRITLAPFWRILTGRKQLMQFCVSCTTQIIKLRLNPWYIMDYFNDLFSTFLDLDHVRTLAVYGRVCEHSDYIKKYLNLFSEDERRSYGFETTWGWAINDRIFSCGWTNPLSPVCETGGISFKLVLVLVLCQII